MTVRIHFLDDVEDNIRTAAIAIQRNWKAAEDGEDYEYAAETVMVGENGFILQLESPIGNTSKYYLFDIESGAAEEADDIKDILIILGNCEICGTEIEGHIGEKKTFCPLHIPPEAPIQQISEKLATVQHNTSNDFSKEQQMEQTGITGRSEIPADAAGDVKAVHEEHEPNSTDKNQVAEAVWIEPVKDWYRDEGHQERFRQHTKSAKAEIGTEIYASLYVLSAVRHKGIEQYISEDFIDFNQLFDLARNWTSRDWSLLQISAHLLNPGAWSLELHEVFSKIKEDAVVKIVFEGLRLRYYFDGGK